VLDNAGLGDHFLDNRSEVMDEAEDEDNSVESAFLEEWLAQFDSKDIKAKDLLTLNALPEVNGVKWTIGHLGPYLREKHDKWIPLDDGKREVCIERRPTGYRRHRAGRNVDANLRRSCNCPRSIAARCTETRSLFGPDCFWEAHMNRELTFGVDLHSLRRALAFDELRALLEVP
jgi:hypothetical protein